MNENKRGQVKVHELIKELNSYDEDAEIKVFDDYGSNFALRAIETIITSNEFNDDEEEIFVVITLK